MNTEMENKTGIQWLLEQLPKLEAQIPQHLLTQAKWQEDKTLCEAFGDGQKNGYEYAKKIDVLHNPLDYYKNKYQRKE
jgi:hypothetical protein